MNTKPFVLRIAAVVCSLLLLGGYIYERAVGGLVPKWRTTQPIMRPRSDDSMLPGPKSALVEMESESSPRPVLGGSKSAPLVEPHLLAPGPTNSPTPPGDSQKTILPGSKSIIIAEPTPQASAPQQQQQRTLMLPGSKSEVIILKTEPAAPVQQPANANPAPRPQ